MTCDVGTHRVAIDPRKYWRRVKCPACRAPMDRFRLRRAQQWLRGKAPGGGLVIGSAVRLIPMELLALLWTLLVIVITIVLHTVADDWWPATVVMYLGRWPWLLPMIPLLAVAIPLRLWRAVSITAVTVIICLFGVMEFVVGPGRFSRVDEMAPLIRIISFNIAGNAPAPLQLVALVTEWQPDVLAVQECGEISRAQLANVPGYTADLGTTCLVTRFPIVRVDSLRRDNFLKAGGAAWVKRYRLKGPKGEFDVTNVHLDTPRKAFEAMMAGQDDATSTVTGKTAVRDLESRLARRWVDLGPGPRVVAGDFNMPSESAIYRRHWGSLTNGFAHAGLGFGATRLAGWIRLRIDHVLVDDGWTVRAARVLPSYGSDHLPLMVDIELR